MKLNIGYFYPTELNLYGDNGNVEILISRATARNINVEVFPISLSTKIDSFFMKNINLVFMGGGPDSGQKVVFSDFLDNKGSYLRDYIENSGVGLYICGSYQLLGNYYKASDGEEIPGLGVFDMYTKHFGSNKPRCIGNVVCKLNNTLLANPLFKAVNKIGDNIVGFENHGGRTYLGTGIKPLGDVIQGNGNNSEDSTEGLHYKNSLGSYFHGPILSRNPHLADYLIAQALGYTDLVALDDTLIYQAHTASLKYK